MLSARFDLGSLAAALVLSLAHLGTALLALADEAALAAILAKHTGRLQLFRETPQEGVKALVVAEFDLHVLPPPFKSIDARDPPVQASPESANNPIASTEGLSEQYARFAILTVGGQSGKRIGDRCHRKPAFSTAVHAGQ